MVETPPTASRVERHSPEKSNDRIELLMRARVRELAERVDEIGRRLDELDQEWDMERTLEANAAIITLTSLLLGHRFLPAVVAAFLLQHAIQGWCPPVSIFRRLGVRTMHEIERERYSLKALRGDFEGVNDNEHPAARASAALDAASHQSG